MLAGTHVAVTDGRPDGDFDESACVGLPALTNGTRTVSPPAHSASSCSVANHFARYHWRAAMFAACVLKREIV
jgi:hypothetical protein